MWITSSKTVRATKMPRLKISLRPLTDLSNLDFHTMAQWMAEVPKLARKYLATQSTWDSFA